MHGGWIYILTNKPFGPLYIGVTNDLARRMAEHRLRAGSVFTARYGLSRLIYAERFDDIRAAIQREKAIKHWPRAWKLNVIVAFNPTWEDLSATFL